MNTPTMPIVAAAIHSGHAISDYLEPYLALSEADRLREEDPYTDIWAQVAPHRLVVDRSRFEADLNRPREQAIYRTPDDAWGLQVWKTPLPDELASRSLAYYDEFYAQAHTLLSELLTQHSTLVMLDLHTYCHRRDGPDAPPADPAANPDVNVGTGTLPDRTPWAGVIDQFQTTMRRASVGGRTLDVRENIKFRGGHFARWTHAHFPGRVCVLSLEFKKFFMDEWTGQADNEQVEAIRQALHDTIPAIVAAMPK